MALFRQNDRVSFNGRMGTVVGIMPNQMIDVRFDDRGEVERRSSGRLRLEETGLARRNPTSSDAEERVFQLFRDSSVAEKDRLEAALQVPGIVALKSVGAPSTTDLEWLFYLSTLSEADRSSYLATLEASKGMGKEITPRLPSERAYEEFEKQRLAQPEVQKSGRMKEPKIQKTGFIRKTALPGSLDEALKSKLAAVFVQDDAPRMASDNETLCGNPIDGNAYYIVVAEQKPRSLSFWVKKDEIAKRLGDRKYASYSQLKWAVMDQLRRAYRNNFYEVSGRSQVRQYVRPRGTVGGGMEPELMIKQKRAQPLSEEVDPNVAFYLGDEKNTHTVKAGDTVAVLANRYAGLRSSIQSEKDIRLWNDLPSGEPEVGSKLIVYPLFFRVSRYESPTDEYLERFSLYGRKQLRLEDPGMFDPKEVDQFGALTVAVLHALRSVPTIGGIISPALAQSMIRSGWVSVEFVPEMDPYASSFRKGDRLTIAYPAKAKNPFFSWVRSEVALGKTGIPNTEAPCLPRQSRKLKEGLSELRSLVRRLEAALNKVRTLFREIADAPKILRTGERGSVFFAVQSLSSAIAALVRWEARLEEAVELNEPDALALKDTITSLEMGPDLLTEDNLSRPGSRRVLDTSQETSLWRRILRGFQTNPDAMGLVGFDGLMRAHVGGSPRLYAANAVKLANELTRQGVKVTRVDKSQGVVEYLVPRTKVKAEIAGKGPNADQEAYLQYRSFMDGLLKAARFSSKDSEGKPILPMPGSSALNFLLGENSNPVLDLYYFILPSLDETGRNRLDTLKGWAEEYGLDAYRRHPYVDPKEINPELFDKAQRFYNAVGLYASGGVRKQARMESESGEGKQIIDPVSGRRMYVGQQVMSEAVQVMTDPLLKGASFTLRPPPSLQYKFDDQVDFNWVIHIVVNELFPALKERMPLQEASVACVEVLLAAYLYRLAGGYELLGPLNPANRVESTNLFAAIQRALLQKESELMGGHTPLSEHRVRTVYMTYNPVLYNVTRLYWPTLGEYIVPYSKGTPQPKVKVGETKALGAEGLQFSNVMAYMQLAFDIDRVGVYGHAAYVTQSLSINSTSEEQIANQIGQLTIARTMNQPTEMILKNKYVRPDDGAVFDVPATWYEPFLLNWSLGDDINLAEEKSQMWMSNPLEYLYNLKQEAEGSLGRVSRMARMGVMPERHPHAPSGSMPVLFQKDRGEMAQEIEERQEYALHMKVIDQLINQQKSKLGGS